MRIAFAMINCNRSDGSARAVNEVAERLARRGHDVHVLARTVRDLDTRLVRWIKIPGPRKPEVADFVTYRFLVNRMPLNDRFDIVHSVGCNTSRADVVTIQNIQPSKRAILAEAARWERVSPLRRLTRWLYLEATTRAERGLYERTPDRPVFLPVSRGVAGELRRHYRIAGAEVRIVPNAADTGVFRPLGEDRRRAVRARFGWNEFVCVFSGGEWKRKGLDFAIRALGCAPSGGWRLAVAGVDPAGDSFRRLAVGCGVADRVDFLGFRKDIPEVLGAGDAFLFPSHYEAFSLATIEAAACGLPVLATKINGTEELVRPGVTGEFLVHDPSAIAAAVGRLVADPALCRAMGEEACSLVGREFTWDRVTDMTEEAYAIARSRPGIRVGP
jgi:glycosyltransferase involved in cell wall biosynthesis